MATREPPRYKSGSATITTNLYHDEDKDEDQAEDEDGDDGLVD